MAGVIDRAKPPAGGKDGIVMVGLKKGGKIPPKKSGRKSSRY